MIKKILKKLLWIVAIIAVLDIGVILALPHLVPMEKLGAMIKEKVRERTGRDLAYADADFVFWPNLGVQLQQVTFSNPAWAQQKDMITLGKADVALALMPLLERQIVIKQFVLNEPAIYLETAADGKQNWDFPAQAAPEGDSSASKALAAATGGKDFELTFGRIEISKGKLIIANLEKKSNTTVEDVNIAVNWPTPKSQLALKGDLTYKGKKLSLDLGLDKPLDFFEGRSSSGQIHVKGDDFTAKADGAFAKQDPLLKGDLDIAVSSVTGMVGWIQGEKNPKKLSFEKISATGATRVTKSDIVVKQGVFAMDDLQAKGDLSFAFNNKPEIFARLAVGKLDLDRFTDGGKSSSGGSAGGSSSSSGWDTTPIDFSGLRMINADLKLQTQGFTLRKVEVGPTLLSVDIKNGTLRFTSSEATLLGGNFSSSLGVNAAAETPAIVFNFNVAGVQAKPLLETFAKFNKLSGTATGHVALKALGGNQRDIIGSLEGKGDLTFKNGTFAGIDLVKIAQLAQARGGEQGVDNGETQFLELGGTFTALRGILSNTDLKMKGAAVQATGQGVVDLPKKYVQYRVTPELSTTSAKTGATTSLAIPVSIKGPFSNIRVIPDLAGTVQGLLKDPSAAKDTVKNLKQNLKKDPAAAIQNLLGSGLLGKQIDTPQIPKLPPSKPAPAPAAVEPAPAPAAETPPAQTTP